MCAAVSPLGHRRAVAGFQSGPIENLADISILLSYFLMDGMVFEGFLTMVKNRNVISDKTFDYFLSNIKTTCKICKCGRV